jgi:hypothetical protein
MRLRLTKPALKKQASDFQRSSDLILVFIFLFSFFLFFCFFSTPFLTSLFLFILTFTCTLLLYQQLKNYYYDRKIIMKAWNYLSGWTSFSLPKNIQKRLYKFLLRKAIGQFLQNELDLENFDIELMNGSVELRDLDLNLQVSKDSLYITHS